MGLPSRRQRIPDGLRNELAALEPRLVGAKHGENFDPNGSPAYGGRTTGRQDITRAVNGDGHHRHLGPSRDRECTPQESANPAILVEGPFRENHQGLAGARQLQHAARVRRALVAVKTLRKLRAQGPPPQSGEGGPPPPLPSY